MGERGTQRERERERKETRDEMFFTKLNPTTFEGIKRWATFFYIFFKKGLCIQNAWSEKISDFSIHEYLHLTASEVNFVCDVWKFLMLCWSNLKQSQNYKHLVLRLFQVWLHIYTGTCIQILPHCFRFNWNGHRGQLFQSTGGTDCTRAAIDFRPLSLPITL